MSFIVVDVNKLPKKDAKFKKYIEELNSVREEPLRVAMYVEDDNVQGLVVYSTAGHLVNLLVTPAVRRGGIGKKIHNYFLANSNVTEGFASLDPENTVGIQFLLSQGWRIYGKFLPHGSNKWQLRMTRKSTVEKYQPNADELACSELLDGAMVFFSVGTKLY
jgi:hypothetical protein